MSHYTMLRNHLDFKETICEIHTSMYVSLKCLNVDGIMSLFMSSVENMDCVPNNKKIRLLQLELAA